ncbi:conserved protein of unknown function [Tepidanaerobacter acetatoxydans Re1]|uniref:Uncharacterized protein n=1 Tax=Tepidanaerobacter acetatoxydans (strain DSM 21804 / JCM 16047 / Re1) TaxID=1209989 RepID=F4LWB3_TEPAE|nr:hypothetical protein [Tepidanaerobacter acetatoxydans]AEE91711.1 hypothetical protein TepRe1_1571 [Tepidanaerobacter acetatoxydans Re1]CCP26476.1 conserved protein of unknown function [Tepidanaerobacter acetatoxydans Re1]
MITTRQRKGVVLGIIWSFISWIPFYTEYLSTIRGYVGIPAALGLNLELALNRGDAFVFSILLGAGIGFFTASLLDFFTNSVKIIGLFQAKGKKLSRRGL